MIEMKANVRRRRLWATLLVVFWLGVGLAVPFLVSFQGEEIRFDDITVLAAPRDTFDVSAPIALDHLLHTHVTAGRLALGSSKGQTSSARASAKLIESGDAMLILDRGEIVLGETMTSMAPVARSGGRDVDAPIVTALKTGSFKFLAIRNGTIIVRLPGGHVERLTQAQVQLVPESSDAVNVKGEGFWRGQRSKFTLRSESADGEGRLPLEFSLQASLLNMSFDGRLNLGETTSLVGAATLAVTDVERLTNALRRSWPIGPVVQEVHVKGPVRWQSDMLAFDKAIVSINGNDARGTLGLKTTASGRGVLTGTLAFDTFDIAASVPREATIRGSQAWQWWRKLAASLSGKSMPPVDADIRFSAAKVVSGEQEFGAAAATIAVKDGRLAADVAEVNLLEGRATGQLSVDFNRFIPAIRLRGQLDGIPSGKWFEAFWGAPVIDGQARVEADLTSYGLDPARIAAQLSGRCELIMDKGARIALALDALRTGVTSDEPQPVADIMMRAKSGMTRVEPFRAIAVFADGVAQLRSSLAYHPKGMIQIAGRFDLLDKAYDLRLLTTDGGRSPIEAVPAAAGAKATAKPMEAALQTNAELRSTAILRGRLLTVRRETFASSTQVSLHPIAGMIDGLQRRLEIGDDAIGRDGF